MRRKPSRLPLVKIKESWAFEPVSESLVGFESAAPDVCVPAGMLALVTYSTRGAGNDERVEVVRAGQVVPQTLAGGQWEFRRGTMVRV